MAPMGTFFSSIEQQTDYFVERAKNDVGLIVTGATSVHPGGGFGELKLERDEDIEPFVPMVQSVQQAGAKFVCQLNHAGRYAPSHKIGMQTSLPSLSVPTRNKLDSQINYSRGNNEF
jgi:2,4-dienoyl-CoA reductase-like NADH-dependent reductase (Old Yellow Enzyme family)